MIGLPTQCQIKSQPLASVAGQDAMAKWATLVMIPTGLPLMRWAQRRQAADVAAAGSTPFQRAASALPTTPDQGSLEFEAGTGGLSELTDDVWRRHSREIARHRAPRPAGSQGTLLRVESAPDCRRRRGGEFTRPSALTRPASVAEVADEGGTPKEGEAPTLLPASVAAVADEVAYPQIR